MILVPHLRQIILADAGADTGVAPDQPIAFVGVSPPRPRALRKVLGTWLGAPLTTSGLGRLGDAIVAHYERCGCPVVELLVPEQDGVGGILRMLVTGGVVGDILLESGSHFKAERLAKLLRLKRGEPLTVGRIDSQVATLSRNPFRSVSTYASPGSEPGEADLLFQVEDRFPFRLYAGYDNRGTSLVGEERAYTGFNWGNVFGLDHLLSYQFTSGEDIDTLAGHALAYTIPLWWGHEFRLSGAYAEVEVPLQESGATFLASGTSWEVLASYRAALPSTAGLDHAFTISGAFKSADNDLAFGGLRLTDSVTETAQLSGTYEATRKNTTSASSLRADVVWSPGNLTGNNTGTAFSEVRAGADSSYVYGSLSARHLQSLPATATLVLRGTAQWSDAALLPGEQLALGGVDSVRGYAERAFLGDSGYSFSTEILTPALPLARRFSSVDDSFQLLAFFDYGFARGLPSGGDTELSSGGLGFRYRIGQRVNLRFDYGWRTDGGGSHGHAALVVAWP